MLKTLFVTREDLQVTKKEKHFLMLEFDDLDMETRVEGREAEVVIFINDDNKTFRFLRSDHTSLRWDVREHFFSNLPIY